MDGRDARKQKRRYIQYKVLLTNTCQHLQLSCASKGVGWSTIWCVCCIPEVYCTQAACLVKQHGSYAQLSTDCGGCQLPSWLPTASHAFTLCHPVHQHPVYQSKFFLQADNVLKGKPGAGSHSRGAQGAKSIVFDSFARYLSFVHFAVFCLLSLLKAVVSSHCNVL